jgi:Fe-S cluster biosynthesis and repair protein YggX
LILWKKVNGIDVSNYPHEEAVKIFLNAPEPIVIEVKRRPTGHSNGGEAEPNDTLPPLKPRLSPQHQSVASQTSDDWLREKLALLHEYSNFDASARDEEIEVEMVENEFDEDEDDEEGLSPDIDIEVSLLSASCRRLIFLLSSRKSRCESPTATSASASRSATV